MGCAQLPLFEGASVGHPPEKRHLHAVPPRARQTVGLFIRRHKTPMSLGKCPEEMVHVPDLRKSWERYP